MCYEDENNCNSIGTKHNSLSLNELLKNYFNVTNNIKGEVHELMSNSPYLWKTRPLSNKLNYYAGCDVLYLPKIYDFTVKKYEKKVLKKLTLSNIFKECEKYLQYLNINKNIKNYNKMNLTKGTKIKGLIKNFQHHCVYVQLNIGYFGVVNNFASVQYLIEKYKLGDIIDFTILDIENKRKRMILDIIEKKQKIKDSNEDIEEEKKIDSKNGNNYIDNKIINLDNNNNSLIHGININKESFFPKSYLQDKKYETNYNNFNNNYQNKSYENNIQNYIKENDNKNNYNNIILNNEILNNNYNGLFYNDKENYYYYDKSNDNNEDNEDSNSDSYYYTLKPFPK